MNPYFDFALQADEAEFMYRMTNVLLNSDLEPHEVQSTKAFQARLLNFLAKHPVKYGGGQ